MTPIPWSELVAQPLGAMPFLIDPYIPEGGSILLYGKTRVGKSPLTWEMARCIGNGTPFFGHPVRQGRVVLLEFDTPRRLVQPRVESLEVPQNVWWEFVGPCHLPTSLPVQMVLRQVQHEVTPDFVIVNTLRKIHQGDEKDGSLPSRIYGIFRAIFPQAATLFVHHDKKSSGDPEDASDPDEAFSGHQAWLNDCQTGLHLMRSGGRDTGLLKLVHTKSQVSAEALPLRLQLDKGGSVLIAYVSDQARKVINAYYRLPPTMPKTERVQIISVQVGLSERQVWTYLSRLPEPAETEDSPEGLKSNQRL